MKPIYAIAKLTVKSAFRFKIVALLAVFLVLAVSALPLLLKDDGTARGFVQILLTYSLGLTVTTLALSTLWLSCSLLAKDIEDCRIQMLVVKPVSRWKIWFGKWLGVMTINALLLAIAGGVILGLLQYRSAKLNEKQKHVLQNEIFVARGSAKEAPVDLTQDVENIFQQKMTEGSTQGEVDKAQLKKQIREMLKYQYQLVPEGHMRVWNIPLGMAANKLKDKPLYLKTKFIAMSHTSTFEDTRSFPMMWEVGPMNSPQSWRTVIMMTPNVSQEIEVPPNLIDEKGFVQVRFINDQNDTFFFDMNDGLEILYRQGGFFINYVKGLSILFCWLGLLAAVGLSAGPEFVSTLTSGGLVWVWYGFLITVIPILIMGILGRWVFKFNYFALMGTLSGSMTNPIALSFITSNSPNDIPAVSYSTVYPLTMFLRVVSAQILMLAAL